LRAGLLRKLRPPIPVVAEVVVEAVAEVDAEAVAEIGAVGEIVEAGTAKVEAGLGATTN
jgi:hypothetical protein